jgi:hypothetical protein
LIDVVLDSHLMLTRPEIIFMKKKSRPDFDKNPWLATLRAKGH